MKSPRSRFESYLGTTIDYRKSKQIPAEILDGLVARLREGDRTVANEIIMGHLRMVMGILSSHRSRNKASDVEGAALLALVEAVHNACPYTDEYGEYHESALYDNNITYYITSNVNWAIKDEYGNSHVLRMPPRTVRYKIARGKKFEDIVPGRGIAIQENDKVQLSNFIMPFFIPIAKPEFPAIEFTELLNKSVENETQRAIVHCRSQGCTYEETGKRVGLSVPSVQQNMVKIERRFDLYNK